ncbi:hypothetical protein K7432_001405 [Basidiobolus ranarum]|uniref:Subtilisin inhibitor domain-containing protein n=1 Tax=Basidiobolus ranarum TaxID=34480 RepID=A0ABR2X319_9FUNG
MRLSYSLFTTFAVVFTSSVTIDAQGVSASVGGNQAHYQLVIHKGEDTTGKVLSQVTLNCHPTGGSHPHAKQACSALDKAEGDFEKLHNSGGICNFIFDPVTVTAKGRGFGKKVNFKKTFSNSCVADGETDGVFKF